MVLLNAVAMPALAWTMTQALPVADAAAVGVTLAAAGAGSAAGLKAAQLSGRADLALAVVLAVALQLANVAAVPLWSGAGRRRSGQPRLVLVSTELGAQDAYLGPAITFALLNLALPLVVALVLDRPGAWRARQGQRRGFRWPAAAGPRRYGERSTRVAQGRLLCGEAGLESFSGIIELVAFEVHQRQDEVYRDRLHELGPAAALGHLQALESDGTGAVQVAAFQFQQREVARRRPFRDTLCGCAGPGAGSPRSPESPTPPRPRCRAR
jgi:hypothetical protein